MKSLSLPQGQEFCLEKMVAELAEFQGTYLVTQIPESCL